MIATRVTGKPLVAVLTGSGYRETTGDHFMLSHTGTSEGQSRNLTTSTREAPR